MAKKAWGAVEPYQMRVRKWIITTFGDATAYNTAERTHRFLEEAVELSQATGCSRADAHVLVDYVFDRPVGETHQEVGGVMVTLAGLCAALGLSMDQEAERELGRVWSKIDAIRAKQATKPAGGPLPGASPAPAYFGMAWDFQHSSGAHCKGKSDGGIYQWDREHAEDMIEQMNFIYGAGTHWIVPA